MLLDALNLVHADLDCKMPVLCVLRFQELDRVGRKLRFCAAGSLHVCRADDNEVCGRTIGIVFPKALESDTFSLRVVLCRWLKL